MHDHERRRELQLSACTAVGGSTAFSGLSSGTNTTAAMLVGTGGSLGVTGTGTISANQLNGAAVPTTAALLASNSSAQATAVSTGAGLTIGSATLANTRAVNAQSGTTYTVLSSIATKLVTFSNASAVAVTLPQATGSFGAGFYFHTENKGAGTVTITPTTSTINGAATLTIATSTGCAIVSDGTNYQVTACSAIGGGGGGVRLLTDVQVIYLQRHMDEACRNTQDHAGHCHRRWWRRRQRWRSYARHDSLRRRWRRWWRNRAKCLHDILVVQHGHCHGGDRRHGWYRTHRERQRQQWHGWHPIFIRSADCRWRGRFWQRWDNRQLAAAAVQVAVYM